MYIPRKNVFVLFYFIVLYFRVCPNLTTFFIIFSNNTSVKYKLRL